MNIPDTAIDIIFYSPELKLFFKELNREWLEKYFSMTEEDEKILDSPEKIIQDGGLIFFARNADKIVGTCALIKLEADCFELAKMGVTEKMQGKGVGLKLLQFALSEAKKNGAKKVILDTATKLTRAIALYKRAGFIQTSEEHVHPLFKRITFQMEKKLV